MPSLLIVKGIPMFWLRRFKGTRSLRKIDLLANGKYPEAAEVMLELHLRI
jgi:hypothetical protein